MWSFKNTTLMHSLVGFVLSMLLIFRTNTAYERWWEGRKLWGSFVNNSRNLALKLHAFLPADAAAEQRAMFRDLIVNFIFASKDHLRKGVNVPRSSFPPGGYDAAYFAAVSHVPNQILKALFSEITRLLQKAVIITGDQLIVLNAELQSFADNLGACERIKKHAHSLCLQPVFEEDDLHVCLHHADRLCARLRLLGGAGSG
jgi:putative membrane protein